MDRRPRELNLGALIFGAVLVFVGIYYVLRNTLGLDMADLDQDKIWPIIVVALGIAVLTRVYTRSRSRGNSDT